MEWRENINKRLREAFNLLYELNNAQHAADSGAAFYKWGELFSYNPEDTKEMLDFARSPNGQKAMVLFRKYSDNIPETTDPQTWGEEIAQEIHDQIVGAENV